MLKKYKTFEDAERDLWCLKPDRDYFNRTFVMMRTEIFRKNLRARRGIFKYRTIEDAQKAKRVAPSKFI